MEDLMFMDLSMLSVEVTDEEIEQFLYAISRKGIPNQFTFETIQGIFRINRKKKEFRILKRSRYDDLDLFDYPTDAEIDEEIAFICKLANRSGYKFYLENKYSN